MESLEAAGRCTKRVYPFERLEPEKCRFGRCAHDQYLGFGLKTRMTIFFLTVQSVV
jgi:hypothetical protein